MIDSPENYREGTEHAGALRIRVEGSFLLESSWCAAVDQRSLRSSGHQKRLVAQHCCYFWMRR